MNAAALTITLAALVILYVVVALIPRRSRPVTSVTLPDAPDAAQVAEDMATFVATYLSYGLDIRHVGRTQAALMAYRFGLDHGWGRVRADHLYAAVYTRKA